MEKSILAQITDSLLVKQKLLTNQQLLDNIAAVARVIVTAYQADKKVLIAGNGGSAADAQHMAGELVSRFYFDRPPLSAIALTVDTSILTAIGNDYGYEKSFLRQIDAHGRQGDVYIAISTSGNSKNIVESLAICKQRGIVTVGLTGNKACQMDALCDYMLKVDSAETPRIQEAHLLIEHTICAVVEEALFSAYKSC